MPDGIRTGVIQGYLLSVVEQMRRTLVRTAFNPVIYEVLDFGISLHDVSGDLIVEAPGIPDFIGANDFALHKALEFRPASSLRPGDVMMLNYPYWSSAHTYDAMLLMGLFDGATASLCGFLCVRAHWMDLGAKDPGYVLDSTDMHQEGLIMPCIRIVKEYKPDEEILDIIRFNSRMPGLTLGDFHAQLAALRTGERRFQEVVGKFGWAQVHEVMSTLIERGERVARACVRDMPDGSWTATAFLDDDGVTEAPVPMRVTVTVAGDSCIADFQGSAAAVEGPVNMPFGATVSMVKCLFKSITTPTEPSNAGHYRCLTVLAPAGSLFNASYPSPTFTLWTQFPAYEMLRHAFAQFLPGVGASSGGDEPGFMVVGVHSASRTVYSISNNEGIGWGAGPWGDGSSALQHPSTSVVRNTPIEVLESKVPILHHRLELIPDSGGPGRFRGGLGVLREVEFLEEAEVLSMKKNTMSRPWGLAGGGHGSHNSMVLWPGTQAEQPLRMRRARMRPGDRFVNRSAGGGGYGDPAARDPRSVEADVKEGYVSQKAASSLYGWTSGVDS